MEDNSTGEVAVEAAGLRLVEDADLDSTSQ
jgi:hypothetical protein